MRHAIRTLAMTGTVLALGLDTPATAQGVDPNDAASVAAANAYVERMQANLADGEAARLRGDCAGLQTIISAARRDTDIQMAAGTLVREQHNVQLDRIDALAARPCPPESGGEGATIHSGVSLGPIWSSKDLGPYEAGFTRDGAVGQAPDLPAGFLRERVDFWGLTGHFYIPGTEGALGIARPIRLGVRYGEGDRSATFDIPSGSHQATGFAYGAKSPGDSTGIGTPGFALSGDLSTSYTGWEFNLAVPLLGSPGPKRTPLTLDALFGLRLDDHDHRSSVRFSETFGGFTYEASQERDQRLDQTFYDFGLAAGIYVPLGGDVVLRSEGYAGGYYSTRDLASLERIRCNFCPLPDSDFTIDIAQSDSGWGVRGNAQIGIEFLVSPNVSIGVVGGVDYLSNVARVVNPISGDQVLADETTRIETEDTADSYITIPFIIRF